MNSAQGLYDEISLAEEAIGDALDRISYSWISDAETPELEKALRLIHEARDALESIAKRHDTMSTTDTFVQS